MATQNFGQALRSTFENAATPVRLPERLFQRLAALYLDRLLSVPPHEALAAASHVGEGLRRAFWSRGEVTDQDVPEAEEIVRRDCPLCAFEQMAGASPETLKGGN